MWRKKDKRLNGTKDELYIRDILLEYLKNPKVKKEVTPTTNIYYLSNTEENIFLMLGDDFIQITNHEFFYNKSFSIKYIDRLKKMIDTTIEKEKEAFRKHIFSNEIDLLRTIFKAVKE
jgi:hypothetical protein